MDGALRDLVHNVLLGGDRKAQALATVDDAALTAMWAAPRLDGALMVVAAREARDATRARCLAIVERAVDGVPFAAKTPAQRARAKLLPDALAAARRPAPSLALVALAKQIGASQYRSGEPADQRALGAVRVLLELLAMRPDVDEHGFAITVAGVGGVLYTCYPEVAAREAAAIRASQPAPTRAELSAWPCTDAPAPTPLDALLSALLHGPRPLAKHLATASWTAASLATAWRKSDQLAAVLALPALSVELDVMRPALAGLLTAARIDDAALTGALPAIRKGSLTALPWRQMKTPLAKPLRLLITSTSGFVRAHGAARLGRLLGESAALATGFRKALDVDAKELHYWLGLFAESSQAAAIAALKRTMG